jgi:hypothetical protein
MREVADHLLEPSPFGELVMNNRLYVFLGLDIVKQPLQLLIMDAVEVLSSIYLLEVLVASFRPGINFLHERLVCPAHFCLVCPINKSILAFDLDM